VYLNQSEKMQAIAKLEGTVQGNITFAQVLNAKMRLKACSQNVCRRAAMHR